MPTPLPPRPTDATLSVTKAARLLGVHPNTVRAWSDAGRLRYYRINPRGDRRYRLGDLQRFLAAAETTPPSPVAPAERGSPHGAPIRRPARGDRGELAGLGPAVDHEGVFQGQIEAERRRIELEVLGELAGLAAEGGSLDGVLAAAARTLRDRFDLSGTAILEIRDDRLVPRAVAALGRPAERSASFGHVAAALASRHAAIGPPAGPLPGDGAWLPLIPGSAVEIAAPLFAGTRTWGVLVLGSDVAGSFCGRDQEFAEAVARLIASAMRAAALTDHLAQEVHRAEALRRVADDIGGRLDLDQTLSGLVDHALVLFAADRAAVFLVDPDGQAVAEVARGLSQAYLAAVRDPSRRWLTAAAAEARRPLHVVDFANDPRSALIRAAAVQEGFDTVCAAPLFDGDEMIGIMSVYHDRPHEWTSDELDTMGAFATQASIAIRIARNYGQMATWAAQLQSIQQLGVRLSRLSSVREIGMAIATELRPLIDYHNVRVYRLYGEDLIPVAMQGQVGEYIDETPEQLETQLGVGITGWVALHKVAQILPDAARDPRASTIPGTEPGLAESMILAPMLFEDQVLGVVVLSKLGLAQFTDDDLRLLVIYASFAAQAMANADATGRLRAQSERLERQLEGQRALLGVTESILTTLDPKQVFEQIADRLGGLLGYDTISVEIWDADAGTLRPLAAKGIHAEQYLEPWKPGEVGLAHWVLEHNEPQLVPDQTADGRANHLRDGGPQDGSLIVAPLRGRAGAIGVLLLERLGRANRFTEDEFELVKLFAAQVSIALQNAERHSAVEVRARTDDLTGLLNRRTFEEWLARSIERNEPFSLVMLDLDDFKQVNDTLGHIAGDRFLREVARAIVGLGRETDRVFRFGGDEIAMILPGSDRPGANGVAERVRRAVLAISGPGTRWCGTGIRASASIGVATFPADGRSPAEVVVAADRACFFAKRSGGNRIADANEGLALAEEFTLHEPTPVDAPSLAVG